MWIRLIIPFIAAAMAGFVIAGCGDDDSAGSAEQGTIETSSLSKTQFIERASEICRKGSAPVLELLTEYMQENEKPGEDEEVLVAEAIKQVALPILEKQFDEIEELGAPQGDESKIESLLAAQREGVAAVEKRNRMALATNVEPDFRRAGDLSRQYGIEPCAYG